jgi:flagellar L-ring protein precursor FlgH
MKTIAAILFCCAAVYGAKKPAPVQALDAYIAEAVGRGEGAPRGAPGSLWSASAPMADLGRDVRAFRVDDLLTIVVLENASATASGSVDTNRSSSASASITALGGIPPAASRLANLAGLQGERRLQGEGATSRQTSLSTTLSARVTHVLPNGYLVVEGIKTIQINSEQQTVRIRGVARPADMDAGNVVRSDRLAQMEIVVNGKGVVGDAIRRPFFLYRLLTGILPF